MNGPVGRDVLLVCGPPCAGVTAMAGALRATTVGEAVTAVVEPAELRVGDVPAAVVFVVSAAARLVASDCAVLDTVIDRTAVHPDRVIAVVSKIDVHRDWMATLEADRAAATAHRGGYAALSWLGVAAAPNLGSRRIAELVQLLTARLGTGTKPGAFRRPARLPTFLPTPRGSALGSERAPVLRGRVQRARVELGALTRSRCVALRRELVEAGAVLSRPGLPAYPARVRSRLEQFATELDDAVTEHLALVAAELGLPDEVSPPAIAAPPLDDPAGGPGGAESGLMILLGAGVGLGVALTLGRLVGALVPGHATAVTLLGVAAGIAVTCWVVAVRRLLAVRIAMQRWTAEVVDAVRGAADEALALRIVAVEQSWGALVRGESPVPGDRPAVPDDRREPRNPSWPLT